MRFPNRHRTSRGNPLMLSARTSPESVLTASRSVPLSDRFAILGPPMAARLVALAGPVQGMTWTLDEELSIGRSNINRVQIEDRSLSRQQFVIREEQGRFVVED